MTDHDLFTIDGLKADAKRLRAALATSGKPLSHSQALEAVARQRGFRDWNAAHAAAGNRPAPPPLSVGQRVAGAYLGHRIAAEVKAVRVLGDGRFRVTLDLDAPVNVSAFEALTVERRRITANIRRTGETVEKISSGAPQLKLDL